MSPRTIIEFNSQRLIRLIRNRIVQDMVPLGIGAAIILGINLLVMFFKPHQAFFNHSDDTLWTISITLGTCLLASGAFKEMQSGKSGTDWLLLPASSLEKYLAAVLELIILIPLLAIALATGLSALLAGIQSLAGGTGGNIYSPLFFNHPSVWGSFLIGNLLFLTGSLVFRKNALIKTIGVLIAFALVLSVVLAGGGWLLLRDNANSSAVRQAMNGFSAGWDEARGMSTMTINGTSTPQWMETTLSWTWGILYFGLTPLAALLFGWFRVREKEAKDAVQ